MNTSNKIVYPQSKEQPARIKGEKWDMKEEKDHFQITEANESHPQEPDVIAQVFGSYKEAKERSKRIVECVNAMAGIQHPADYIKAKRAIDAYKSAEIDSLRNMQDKLMNGLKKIMNGTMANMNPGKKLDKVYTQIETLLKQAELK